MINYGPFATVRHYRNIVAVSRISGIDQQFTRSEFLNGVNFCTTPEYGLCDKFADCIEILGTKLNLRSLIPALSNPFVIFGRKMTFPILDRPFQRRAAFAGFEFVRG